MRPENGANRPKSKADMHVPATAEPTMHKMSLLCNPPTRRLVGRVAGMSGPGSGTVVAIGSARGASCAVVVISRLAQATGSGAGHHGRRSEVDDQGQRE